jgi:ABC-type multidrug transport system permease subunit
LDFSSSAGLFFAFFFFFLGLFFFPNFEITCPATYYLPTTNQLPPFSPTYLLNIYIISTTTNENNSNAGIAFSRLAIN